jgi:Flp pilus assembly protein TadG
VRASRVARLRREPCAGAVTAETAVALPALVVVIALSLWAVGAVSAQLRCVDAARLAARAVARGDDPGVAVSRAEAAAPPGATVRVAQSSGLVTVQVRAQRPLLGGVLAGAGVEVSGTATADAEHAGARP